MKEDYQHVRRFAVMCSIIVLLGLTGCQQAATQADSSASLDSTTQTLMQFVGDFARQAFAAYLL
jgi:hypothetical protein